MTAAFSRRGFLTSSSAVAAIMLTGCARAGKSPGQVAIGTTEGLNLTMMQLLRQQGFLKLFDIDANVIALADGTRALGGIYSGSIDVVPMSGFGQVFPAIERGADLAIINAATLTPLLALFSAKPAVKGLKDFEGKVVGVGSLGSLDYMLTVTLLRKYSVNIDSVHFVNIGSNIDTFKAVMAGTVDAGMGPASYVDDAAAYNVHAIEHGDMSVELKDFTYQAGWTSKSVIASRRGELVRLLAAYAKLFRFVELPSARDAFLAASKTVFPNSAEREHIDEWTFLQRSKPFALDLALSEERVRYVQQINVDFHIQKEVLPFDRVANMSLAQDALKLLG